MISRVPEPYQAGTLRVNGTRLNETLHETCKIGAAHTWGSDPTETGMCRLALSDEDRQVRDWFCEELKTLGCEVRIDEMGNMFGIRPGRKEGKPTAMGSHLDTQPTGGRYDGILGVMAAVEVLRVLKDNNVETEYPVAAITWTNEEGARFPKSMHGSAVWADIVSLEQGWGLTDVNAPEITAKGELERIGYMGKTPCSFKENPLGAHFELHIEQGPILEEEEKRVGVVLGGQAYRWFNIDVIGKDSHAGTTPLKSRSDAMLSAARFICFANEIAAKHNGLTTTGIINLQPGSINTIAKTVSFSLDIRHLDDSVLDKIEAEIREQAEILAKGKTSRGCTINFTDLFKSPVVHFAPECVGAIRSAAVASVGEDLVRDIYSGAGHDSCCTARHCPTGMIFIPCKDGVSHNPEEYSTPEDCTLGAQVLLDAVMSFDSKRTV